MKGSIIAYAGILAMKLTFLPNTKLLGWVFVLIAFDFVTGVIKAKLQGQEITSKGFRETIKKLVQNVGLILLGIVMGNVLPKDNEVTAWVNDGLLMFIIYVEAYSIIENLRDMNPESKATKLIFVPLLSILTIGIDKLSLLKKAAQEKTDDSKQQGGSGASMVVLIMMGVGLLAGCKVVQPGIDSYKEKTDSSWTNYKNVPVDVKGATVGNNVNVDSLLSALRTMLQTTRPGSAAGTVPNIDSILNVFKKGLRPLKDTVMVTDPTTKVVLKYWMDAAGRLQITCTSKDETINVLVAENNKLRKETEKSKSIEVVYKMPWWGWVALGWAFMATGGLILLLYLAFKTRR